MPSGSLQYQQMLFSDAYGMCVGIHSRRETELPLGLVLEFGWLEAALGHQHQGSGVKSRRHVQNIFLHNTVTSCQCPNIFLHNTVTAQENSD